MRMFITKYVLESGSVPLNPFMLFDYFLLDVADRDVVRNANNNLVALADELWIFGPVSDGVFAEIEQMKRRRKKVRYFEIKHDKKIDEVDEDKVVFEHGVMKP